MSNKDILRKLFELEAKLQQEKQEKANLEADFYHLLDQLKIMQNSNPVVEERAVVCG